MGVGSATPGKKERKDIKEAKKEVEKIVVSLNRKGVEISEDNVRKVLQNVPERGVTNHLIAQIRRCKDVIRELGSSENTEDFIKSAQSMLEKGNIKCVIYALITARYGQRRCWSSECFRIGGRKTMEKLREMSVLKPLKNIMKMTDEILSKEEEKDNKYEDIYRAINDAKKTLDKALRNH